MTETVRRPRESLDEAAAKLLTTNADGSYSIRIPYEKDRVITVTDKSKARVIAMAAAARERAAALLQPAAAAEQGRDHG